MYQRSAADVRAEVLVAQRRREQDSVRLGPAHGLKRSAHGMEFGNLAMVTAAPAIPASKRDRLCFTCAARPLQPPSYLFNVEPVCIQWCCLVSPSVPVAGAQMLMTRATREKLAAQRSCIAAAGNAAHAVVRVRLPDGVIVQVPHGKDGAVLACHL